MTGVNVRRASFLFALLLLAVGTAQAQVHVHGSVYGGGALANANIPESGTLNTATVNLTGGVIDGAVYGGGLGRRLGDDPVAAYVGNTVVNLNPDVDDAAKGCVVGGAIFGCNNQNGTPKGSATVNVYKTQNSAAQRIVNTGEVTNAKVTGRYDVTAVYGGGNVAAYVPTDLMTGKTQVNIYGCDCTSIETVYGGGNAASTPATEVTVNGTFEIGEVFGGGNGRDPIDADTPNPGANVGYYTYPDDADFDTRNSSTYTYGTGKAQVNIYGGTIHAAYGGSNTKGNVREIAMTMLDSASDGCDFCVDEAYGGGKEASMDGQAVLEMKCIPGMAAIYGGAQNADVNQGVKLNITNGTYGRVFGGNNKGGRILGSIEVNIEETGCNPVIIGELYGGGNAAPYSVCGYHEQRDENGEIVTDATGHTVWEANETGDVLFADPQVNVKSCTSIGAVYGGGYGEEAVMVGSPRVYIDMVLGDKAAQASEVSSVKVGEDANGADVTVSVPTHAAGEIGAIGTVFGGGNAARVIGDTYVNIGTRKTIDYVTKADGKGLTVKGANIVGDVYGGGNNATVTGNTHVNIGRK